VIAPIAVALALVVGGIAYANRSSSDPTDAGPGAASSVMGTASTAAAPSSAASSPTPSSAAPSSSAPSSPQPSATPDSSRAKSALTACQKKVRQGDKVLEQAKIGVGHWATHVQAQTDADSSRITIEEMDGKFAKTRLAGPADQKRYADALFDYRKLKGSCAAVEGATKPVATALAKCAERAKEQRPVMTAAAAGMKDWKSHLAAMQRSREGHVENAEAVWLKAWRAAPPHIKAYQKAAAAFDAPSC
jgi:hypothetical protein